MERKRYIPPDPRKRPGAEPLPPIEEAVPDILRQLGLPPVRIDGNRILSEDGELIAVRGIDPETGKRTLTLCGEWRKEPYTIYWQD